jgi:nucleoside-diphosphate kinase
MSENSFILSDGRQTIISQTPKEETLVIVKPDGMRRDLLGVIIKRIINKGFELVKLQRYDEVSEKKIETHYDHIKNEPYFKKNCDFVCEGPITVMVFRGENAVKVIYQQVAGKIGIPGTIRGDYANHVTFNVIHSSDSIENAAKEINLWFPQ